MPRPVSRSVVIGLHYVQAEQVEVPAMYSAVSGATVVPANSHSSRLPVFCFSFSFCTALTRLCLGKSSVDHPKAGQCTGDIMSS